MINSNKLQVFRRYASQLGFRQALLLQTARLLRIPTVTLTIPDIRYKVKCRPSDSDRHTLAQVFFERDSDVLLQDSPRFIIDGGANIGYASVLFANKYPRSQIIAIEPDLNNYQLALANCASYSNIKVVRGAIWTSNTPVVIENPNAESWAFRVSQVVDDSNRAVPGYTIEKILVESGCSTIDLLKLDIEGAEEQIFSDSNTDWITRVRVIAIEVHGDGAYRAVTETLGKYNFTKSSKGEKLVFRNQDL